MAPGAAAGHPSGAGRTITQEGTHGPQTRMRERKTCRGEIILCVSRNLLRVLLALREEALCNDALRALEEKADEEGKDGRKEVVRRSAEWDLSLECFVLESCVFKLPCLKPTQTRCSPFLLTPFVPF